MKIIADEEFLDRTEAGNFIGMATSTFDKLLAKSRHGKLVYPLEVYQPGGRGTPMWFSKSRLKEWLNNVIPAAASPYVRERRTSRWTNFRKIPP